MQKLRIYTRQFTVTAKWLHWLIALLMLSVLGAAWSFAFQAPEDRAGAIPVHVSIGLIVVLLTLLRLAWRKAARPPPIPQTTPGWMQHGAAVGHFLLYVLILLQGVLGIWMAALSPVDIRFFNMFDISELAPASAGSVAALRQIHDCRPCAGCVLASFRASGRCADPHAAVRRPVAAACRAGSRTDNALSLAIPG
jgi:cytochrome b561